MDTLNQELEKTLDRIKNFKHINYKDKIEKGMSELAETDPNQVIKWGWTEWDNMF